jgi:hypothetical protein
MVSGGNGGGWSISSSTDGDGVSDSASNSSARYHPQTAATATSTSSNNNIKAHQPPPRRKLRHALNEGSQYSRDYFNLRRPKDTQHNNHNNRRRGSNPSELTSTSTHGGQHSSALSIHSMFSPYINPNNNNNYSSTASFSSTTSATAASIVSASAASGHGGGKLKPQRRRRTSTSKHPTPPQQLQSQLSSSAPLSSSSPPKLQYYYPNPFSTTNLRDMIRLHQESNTTEGDSSSCTHPSSPSPQIMSELGDDHDHEEMMEDVAPLGAPLNHQTQGKKHRVPSAYRSLPQLGYKGSFTHNHSTTHHNDTIHHHQGSSSRIQQMSSYNFFQQVLLDPIDGVEDDINRFKRNEGWKEIRMYNADDDDDDDELGLGGEGSGVGGGRRCSSNAGYLNQLMVDYSVDSTSSSGRITNNSDSSMGTSGIVSDDNDGSAGEEDTTTATNYNKGRVGVQKYWKRKLSVESSTSSYEEEEDGSSPPRQLPAIGASSSSSSSLRRSRNTVGAGLAYGSDTLRSYQSRSSSR